MVPLYRRKLFWILLHQTKRTYIAQLEGLAAVSAYFTHRKWFRGHHVNHWIDNTVALSALLHGSACTTDMALMTSAFHLQLAALRTTFFFDWVPSLANLADDPSRGYLGTLNRMGATRARMDTPTFSPVVSAFREMGRAYALRHNSAALLLRPRVAVAVQGEACVWVLITIRH